jgi:hypothetical protein
VKINKKRKYLKDRISITAINFIQNILTRLSPYTNEIIGYYQCGFGLDRSTTNHIVCILQILEKIGVKWDSTSSVLRLNRKPII